MFLKTLKIVSVTSILALSSITASVGVLATGFVAQPVLAAGCNNQVGAQLLNEFKRRADDIQDEMRAKMNVALRDFRLFAFSRPVPPPCEQVVARASGVISYIIQLRGDAKRQTKQVYESKQRRMVQVGACSRWFEELDARFRYEKSKINQLSRAGRDNAQQIVNDRGCGLTLPALADDLD